VEPVSQPSYIAIAHIVRTRGNRGEVLADLYTDFPARFDTLREVWLEFADGSRGLRVIEEAWGHKGRQVLKFAGTDSISAAERLVGAWVQVESRRAMSLPEGTYYDHQLVGCGVRTVSGEDLGEVMEILHIAGNTQIIVRGRHGEIMIPAAGGNCREVSIEGKRIVVDLPEGLVDLNK
jgi:16S rRNA processing protein RimM